MVKPARLLDALLALKRRGTRRPGPPRGVLVLSCGGLGDTVLFALVVPRLLGLAREGEPVTVLLRKDAARMAFLLPDGVAVETVDFKRLAKDLGYRRQVLESLFAAHYRLVIHGDFLRHPLLDEALVAACAASEAWAMEPRPWPKYDARLRRNRRLYTRLFDSGPAHRDKVLRWARFADWMTGREQPAPVVRLPDSALPPPARAERPTVLIQAFSAVAEKQPHARLFEAIIDALGPGYDIAFLGAPGELDRNPDFKPLVERPNVGMDTSSFAEVVPRLRAADLVISVDTALMHLAVAVGARTLCLASAAYVGEIVPYAPEVTPDNAHFLYQPMDCQGCLGACPYPPEDGMYPCVAKLDEARVLAAVRDLL